jgi:formylglycine-generating enzyme required for sulfatase activity
LSATELILRDPLGERPLTATDFPVSIGGPGHTVVLPGAGTDTLAWIALHDGQLFLQPDAAAAATAPLCNGAPVTRATWLRAGDVIDVARGRLRVAAEDSRRVLIVEDGSGGNLTVPPEAPLADVVSGGGDEDDEHVQTVAFRRPAAPARQRQNLGPRLVGGMLAALLLFSTWFFATGHAVRIAVDPADSTIDMDGGLALRVGANYFARPGDFTVEIEREGYATLRKQIAVTGDADQAFTFKLAKLPGVLDIKTPVAARVSIAGKDVGAAPGALRLPAGRHELVITAPRYLPFTARVDIEGMERRQTLAPQLVANWAPVRVLTEPTGAQVFVDGKAQGTAPVQLELDAGTHHIELRQAGFKNWVTDVQVVANQPQTLGPVRLGLPDGTLVVRSEPAGASLSVGGAFRGRTPVTLEVRPDVELALVAAREGYEPATASLSLGAGERRELQLRLTPILGDVTVLSEPAGAEVFVNGRRAGKAGEALRLPAARTELEVRLAGFQTHRTAVTPRPGLPQVLNVRLQLGGEASPAAPAASAAGATVAAAASAAGTSPASGAALASVIRTKSGAELRLLGPASFTLGSPRRESGRRANESQRAIELRRRFYLGTREVTNGEFKQFRPQHRSGFVGQNSLELERHPVVNLGWQDAAEYCNWLSQQEGLLAAYQSEAGKLVLVQPATTGYRLPTEAEWEWAARANRDGSLRKYPWGDALPVPAGAGNFGDRQAQPLLQTFIAELDDGQPATASVGSYAANPLGFFDLGGNVAEWTTDLYTVQPAGGATTTDPVAAAAGNLHVIRGSSWRHATVTELRAAYRDSGNGRRDDVGLRIARYAE